MLSSLIFELPLCATTLARAIIVENATFHGELVQIFFKYFFRLVHLHVSKHEMSP
jgi:hypothetical protein